MYPMLLRYKCLSVGINTLQFRDFVLVSARCLLKCSMSVSRGNKGIRFYDFMQFRGQISAPFATRDIQNPVWKEICGALIFTPNGQKSATARFAVIFGDLIVILQEFMARIDLVDFVTVFHHHAECSNDSMVLRYIFATVS